MNPWFAKAVILAANIVMVVVRAPHGQRSRGVKVVITRKGPLEIAFLRREERMMVDEFGADY